MAGLGGETTACAHTTGPASGEARRSERRRRLAHRVGLLLAIGGLAWPAVSPAAAPEDGWSYDLAREVMSPFCPGRTLASCPSPQAAELIQWIILQESAGATREEVEEQLYARYGDVIRGAPKPEGWGLAAYLIPLVSAVLGGALVWLVLRRISAGGSAPQPASPAPPEPSPSPKAASDDEIERLVDQELERI